MSVLEGDLLAGKYRVERMLASKAAVSGGGSTRGRAAGGGPRGTGTDAGDF